MKPSPKKVDVYHYQSGVGGVITKSLNLFSSYSAEYTKIHRQTPQGAIAEDISAKKPDLVFLSLNFGDPVGINGRSQEGLDELVRIRERSQVPVVMVTSGDTTYRQEALKKGANGYLSARFTPTELIRLADRLTSQTQS